MRRGFLGLGKCQPWRARLAERGARKFAAMKFVGHCSPGSAWIPPPGVPISPAVSCRSGDRRRIHCEASTLTSPGHSRKTRGSRAAYEIGANPLQRETTTGASLCSVCEWNVPPKWLLRLMAMISKQATAELASISFQATPDERPDSREGSKAAIFAAK